MKAITLPESDYKEKIKRAEQDLFKRLDDEAVACTFAWIQMRLREEAER